MLDGTTLSPSTPRRVEVGQAAKLNGDTKVFLRWSNKKSRYEAHIGDEVYTIVIQAPGKDVILSEIPKELLIRTESGKEVQLKFDPVSRALLNVIHEGRDGDLGLPLSHSIFQWLYIVKEINFSDGIRLEV